MKKIKFSGTIEQNKDMNAGFVRFPFSTEELFNKKGQVKIKALIDSENYRGSLVNMGMGCHVLGITQEIRKKINKSFGDSVEIVIEEDTEARNVIVPNELKKEFSKSKKAEQFFNSLSYSNRKEYVRWIEEAKKEETKLNRLKMTIEKLLAEKRNPSEK